MAVTRKPTTAELHLHARVAELEQQLEARTQTIVTLATRIRELEGDQTPAVVERADAAQRELEQLQRTKLFRLATGPRRVYATARGWVRG